MPNTYEKVEDDRVVERSVAFAGTTHDLQLSTAACNVDSPWFALDANGERVKLDPMPVFIAPSEVDAEVDDPSPDSAPTQVADTAPTGDAADTNEDEPEPAVTDEPDESGDHTEE